MLEIMKNQNTFNQIIYYWLPVVLWAVVIFCFSSIPSYSMTTKINIPDFIFKKSLHLGEYAILAVLIHRAFSVTFAKFNKNKMFWLIIILCFLYGLSDELHQSFTNGRTSKLRDVIIDGFGAYFGLLIASKYYKSKLFKFIYGK